MSDPAKPTPISGHAMAALYVSLAALVLPVFVMYSVELNPVAVNYLDELHHGDIKLMALLAFISAVLTFASIRWGKTARRRIRTSHGQLKGTGRAWAGSALGWVGLTLYSFIFLISFPLSPFAPTMDGSRVAANQAGAVGSLRTVHSVAETYREKYHRGYPRHLSALGPPRKGDLANAFGADLIDQFLATGAKAGYTYVYQVTAQDENHLPSAYSITAVPLAGCGLGGNCYYSDQTGVIRVETDHLPNQHSPPLAQ